MIKKIIKKYLRHFFLASLFIVCLGSIGGCKNIPIIGEAFPFSWIDL